jgi:hypothetical protein
MSTHLIIIITNKRALIRTPFYCHWQICLYVVTIQYVIKLNFMSSLNITYSNVGPITWKQLRRQCMIKQMVEELKCLVKRITSGSPDEDICRVTRGQGTKYVCTPGYLLHFYAILYNGIIREQYRSCLYPK